MTPPPGIAWLLQPAAAIPDHDDWLAPAERGVQSGLRLAPRRAQWRLGRWTAKVALARWLGLTRDDYPRLELRAAADGAPEPWVDGVPLPLVLSLSHCGDHGLVALAAAPVALGADLERVEARSPAFVRDYFTAAEQHWLAAAPPRQVPTHEPSVPPCSGAPRKAPSRPCAPACAATPAASRSPSYPPRAPRPPHPRPPPQRPGPRSSSTT